LADADVRYLVVHADILSEEDLALLEAHLSTPPVYRDDRLLIYSTSPVSKRRQ
jgi:hypothetical protein